MRRTKEPSKPNRLQTGVLVDRRIWQRFKARAALEDRSAAECLDDAMRLYLERHADEGTVQ